ncbi:hypothetical protein T439DRAFT_58586 [Meredithblackwellia eburnea MCA 4105]
MTSTPSQNNNTSNSAPDASGSAFVLLSSAPATTSASASQPIIYTIPRPRQVPILAIVALVDLACSIYFSVLSSRHSHPDISTGALYTWGLVRPLAVFYILQSHRVRDRGWFILAQLITAVVCLYHLNELIQSHRRPPPHTTRFILVSLFISLVHYALFASFIGIRRPSRARGVWGEQVWEGREEDVIIRDDTGRTSRRTSMVRGNSHASTSRGERAEDEFEGHEFEDGEDDSLLGDDDSSDDGEETDEDDIIDMPKHGGPTSSELLRKASRASLRAQEEGAAAATAGRSTISAVGDIRSSNRYGSITSLAGI